MKLSSMIVVAAVAAALAGEGVAQTNTTQGDSKVVGKISSDYSSFLGSEANAKAVVDGLRNGTRITLTSPTPTPGSTPTTPPTTTTTPGTPTPPTTNTTIIDPPTGKMGFGNVRHALDLAQYQLGQKGITQPTPEQLKAALVGGTITTGTGTGTSTGTGTTVTKTDLQGILTMRSQGMGWGKIAQELGTKLGAMKHSNQTTTVANSSSQGSGVVSGSGKSGGSSETGIVSASGKSHGNSGHGASGKHASGQGIVSGSGKGHASGKGGIVTGSGQTGASSGITGAGGHGNSQAKGHNK